MTGHKIRRHMSADGYAATCRCGWRIDRRDPIARELAEAAHLATEALPHATGCHKPPATPSAVIGNPNQTRWRCASCGATRHITKESTR